MNDHKLDPLIHSRVRALDSIRFICAAIVMVGHYGFLPPDYFGASPPLIVKIAEVSLGLLFNGPAAVIVFFVLSGFVIHYPQRDRRSHIVVRAFYARRLIRIGLPAIVAAALYLASGVSLSYPQFGVLWSVICETVYYLGTSINLSTFCG